MDFHGGLRSTYTCTQSNNIICTLANVRPTCAPLCEAGASQSGAHVEMHATKQEKFIHTSYQTTSTDTTDVIPASLRVPILGGCPHHCEHQRTSHSDRWLKDSRGLACSTRITSDDSTASYIGRTDGHLPKYHTVPESMKQQPAVAGVFPAKNATRSAKPCNGEMGEEYSVSYVSTWHARSALPSSQLSSIVCRRSDSALHLRGPRPFDKSFFF